METGLLGYECFAGYLVLSFPWKGGAFIIRIKKCMALDYEVTPFLRSAETPHQMPPYFSQAHMNPLMIE